MFEPEIAPHVIELNQRLDTALEEMRDDTLYQPGSANFIKLQGEAGNAPLKNFILPQLSLRIVQQATDAAEKVFHHVRLTQSGRVSMWYSQYRDLIRQEADITETCPPDQLAVIHALTAYLNLASERHSFGFLRGLPRGFYPELSKEAYRALVLYAFGASFDPPVVTADRLVTGEKWATSFNQVKLGELWEQHLGNDWLSRVYPQLEFILKPSEAGDETVAQPDPPVRSHTTYEEYAQLGVTGRRTVDLLLSHWKVEVEPLTKPQSAGRANEVARRINRQDYSEQLFIDLDNLLEKVDPYPYGERALIEVPRGPLYTSSPFITIFACRDVLERPEMFDDHLAMCAFRLSPNMSMRKEVVSKLQQVTMRLINDAQDSSAAILKAALNVNAPQGSFLDLMQSITDISYGQFRRERYDRAFGRFLAVVDKSDFKAMVGRGDSNAE